MMVGESTEKVDVIIPNDAYNSYKDIPTFSAYLTIIVRDSSGRVLKVHHQKSRSPTANFIGLFLPLTYYSAVNSAFTLTNTAGGTCSYLPGFGGSPQDISYPNSNGAANHPTYLVTIQVGSGQQSNPSAATSLAAPIANGSGAGQLIYGTPTLPSSVIVSGSEAFYYISEIINNQSGGTINITEVGIITNVQLMTYYNTASTSCGQLLVWYDVLSTPISIPNGGGIVLYYTFAVNP
jgi:hypothetical protein